MTAEKSKAADAAASAEEMVNAAVESVSKEKKKPAAKKTAAKKAPAKKAAPKKAPAKKAAPKNAPVKKAAPKKKDEGTTEKVAEEKKTKEKPVAKKKTAAPAKKKSAKSAKKQQLKITQVKSQIGYARAQRKILTGLGLGRIGRSVVRVDHPSIRGMVAKVSHLVSVEEVEA
jgi:ribosomal protein L30